MHTNRAKIDRGDGIELKLLHRQEAIFKIKKQPTKQIEYLQITYLIPDPVLKRVRKFCNLI